MLILYTIYSKEKNYWSPKSLTNIQHWNTSDPKERYERLRENHSLGEEYSFKIQPPHFYLAGFHIGIKSHENIRAVRWVRRARRLFVRRASSAKKVLMNVKRGYAQSRPMFASKIALSSCHIKKTNKKEKNKKKTKQKKNKKWILIFEKKYFLFLFLKNKIDIIKFSFKFWTSGHSSLYHFSNLRYSCLKFRRFTM